MPYAFEVRLLCSGDSSQLRELNRVFARAFSDPQTYLGAAPDSEYLEAWLENGDHIALVATADGLVVGGLVGYAFDKVEQARREIYIYDLAVEEEHRRRGIATALIRRLQQIARETGAWAIFVQADYVDDAAIALYQKLGVREEVIHFDIPVS